MNHPPLGGCVLLSDTGNSSAYFLLASLASEISAPRNRMKSCQPLFIPLPFPSRRVTLKITSVLLQRVAFC
jgi:hypothetical protein